MKRILSTISTLLLLLLASTAEAQVSKHWDFDKDNDREGWGVPADIRAVVMGGSLWLALDSVEKDPTKISSVRYQVFGQSDNAVNIESPQGLAIPAARTGQLQIKLRVLNLSPVTDIVVRWRAKGQEWGNWDENTRLRQSRRCALKPDLKDWQEITCYISQDWLQAIDQIGIDIGQRIRGDLWINWLEMAEGTPEPKRARVDLASDRVIPKVTLPGISQSGFADAFKVLDDNIITDVPIFGFTFPVISPGGYYSKGGWWEIDSSVALEGAKWANEEFAENVLRGFRDVQAQNPDGRIDLWGNSAVRGQVADQSQLPLFFEVAFDIAQRTSSQALRTEIYEAMQRYLNWWLSPVKRDAHTGLISSVFEETFGDRSQGKHITGDENPADPWLREGPMSVAPVDLNVAVAVGAARTAALAAALGRDDDSTRYRRVFEDLTHAINSYLWDEARGVYYNYDLRKGERRAGLNVTTFDPLRLGIAPALRVKRLLKRMRDPAQFNWGKVPLTSWAMTESGYIEAKGDYDGRAWFGNVWTLRNMTVVSGLEESGHPDVAAELNWATIKAFHQNYREFLLPSTGEGQGAQRYSWTAAQYISAIVEHLFGVQWNSLEGRLYIQPHVPRELYGRDIALDDLILPTGENTRLSVHIRQSSGSTATIRVSVTGEPKGELVVRLPSAGREQRVPLEHSFVATF